MWKSTLFTFVIVLAVVCIEARQPSKVSKRERGKGDKSEGGQAQAKDCSEWTFGECTVQGTAACGKGSKKGTRTGDNCPVKEKSFPCRVPCGGAKKCKYQKGEWSECDLATNTMTRTNTLKKGDPTLCEASKVITKKCKNKKAGGRQNNRRRKDGSE